MAERKRVQFDFAPEAYEELSELERQLKVPTKAEVVRYGLRTLQWLVENITQARGYWSKTVKGTRGSDIPLHQASARIARTRLHNPIAHGG